MKKSNSFLSPKVAILLALALMLAIPVWAGDWYGTHGTSGRIQDTGDFSSYSYQAAGFSGTMKSSRTAQIHYAVPTKAYSWPVYTQYKTRYVRVKFQVGSTDVRLTKLSIYDGNLVKYEFNYGWDTGLTGFYDLVLDMGSDMEFTRALGMTLEFMSGSEAMSHTVAIYAVGARYD